MPRSLAEIKASHRRNRELALKAARPVRSTYEPEMLGATGYAFQTREQDCREHEERFIGGYMRVYEPAHDWWTNPIKVDH